MRTFLTVVIAIAIVISFFLSILFLMLGSHNLSTPDYYANKDHYYETDAKILEIHAPESDDEELIINLLEIDEDGQTFEGSFKFVPTNEAIIKENGFYREIKEGDTITITIAPAYFGDGYIIPIAAMKTNDKEYLDFNTGCENQVEYSEEAKATFLNLFIPSVSIFMGSIVSLIVIVKRKK